MVENNRAELDAATGLSVKDVDDDDELAVEMDVANETWRKRLEEGKKIIEPISRDSDRCIFPDLAHVFKAEAVRGRSGLHRVGLTFQDWEEVRIVLRSEAKKAMAKGVRAISSAGNAWVSGYGDGSRGKGIIRCKEPESFSWVKKVVNGMRTQTDNTVMIVGWDDLPPWEMAFYVADDADNKEPKEIVQALTCLLYTSPSPRDRG